MRVLILSQYYEPEPIPKPHDLARALRERGHEASVVTGLPNYPSGRIFDGYRFTALMSERLDGVAVIRAAEFPYHGRRAVGRIANYGSFMLSAPLAAMFAPSADVIYVWHPPLTVGVAAWAIARMRGIPFVYDVQDIWPESAVLAGILSEGALVRFMRKLERFVYRRAAHILTPTEGARRDIVAKGVPPERVTTLPHWVDETLFHERFSEDAVGAKRNELGWGDEFVVLFAGNLGMVQGLETVVEAAVLLRESRVRFVFAGDGADRDRLEGLVAARRLGSKVSFLGRRPMAEMPALMGAADLLLVHLRPSELSKLVIPSKTMAYLAAGKPILMAMEGSAADLVREANAGFVIKPGDPRLLSEMMGRLAAMPKRDLDVLGASGRDYLRRNLSKATVIEKYERILQAAAGARSAAV